jgi:signal transduction histidine kinase
MPEAPGETGGENGHLLMISTEDARGIGRGMLQDLSVLVHQVALALEKMHLLEQARQAAVLEERQRMAREIHDTLAQGFTSIVMHLEAAEAALSDDLATAQHHLEQARSTARESLEEARRLVWALRPQHLERDSLPEALRRVVARWSQESDIPAEVTVTGTPASLHPEVEVTLLRAAQEALTNVRKHARAGRVAVTLSYMDDLVVLDVQDDGVGFDPHLPEVSNLREVRSGGFGLQAMRERVARLGGRLLIESAPGEGTTVVVEVPASSPPPVR